MSASDHGFDGRIRLVISDIDGTLVRNDKSLSEVTVEAVRRAREAGIAFTVISARPPSGLTELARRLDIAAEPIGAFNGGTLSTGDGAVLQSHQLSESDARRTVAMMEAAGVEVWLFADGLWIARRGDTPHAPRERISARLEPTLTQDYGPWLARADKVAGVSDDHDLLRRLEGEIAASLGATATVVRSQLYFLDVTAASANKGDGVSFLAQAMGVPLGEVAVIGDMANDVPMFSRAGFSVAMGQAPEEVRGQADFVTASNEEDGVAKVLDALVEARRRAGVAA